MKDYLLSLLPRLKQYSKDLDRKEVFVDIPWVFIDENQRQQKYIFRRNGELILSLNGDVTIGKWEYISSAKSLLIDRLVDRILLNQNFVDEAVMVLRKDGKKDDNLFLANEILLPDLDVVKYLKSLYYRENRIGVALLKTGETLEVNNFFGSIENNIVTIEGEPVKNGVLELANFEKKFVIEGSRIRRILVKEWYETNLCNILIEHTEDKSPSIGDFVYINEKDYASDGKYKLGFMKYINVENGRIVK